MLNRALKTITSKREFFNFFETILSFKDLTNLQNQTYL